MSRFNWMEFRELVPSKITAVLLPTAPPVADQRGYPRFDQKKADEYYRKVTDKVASLIRETIVKRL